ncbi:rhodanese-like domain-containing protein [Pseudomonas sp. AOB-7]|uniref:rhodanese-like domain-containing protein n=1 Tax=Pseudomonas sp. AOB-7 TaxID=2482750 RepID=UPI000EFBCE8B|nr:rhodanese-like domain-containing protein [Pseudomonas sp. AOB-7]RMH85987.1 rhodanese-like domain-containing protein [Pseudomonas sp. AOB-7]
MAKTSCAARRRLRRRRLQISPRQARAQIVEGVTLLDVRSDSEFREGHIDGVFNLSADQFHERKNRNRGKPGF